MARDRSAEDESSTPESIQVRFHYIKSNFFRVVHADGAHGGITPRGLIEMNFYSERHPIPQLTVHALNREGQLGTELLDQRIERDGPVREIDVGVVMSLSNAIALHEWLGDKIEVLRKRQADAAK